VVDGNGRGEEALDGWKTINQPPPQKGHRLKLNIPSNIPSPERRIGTKATCGEMISVVYVSPRWDSC
jgi:hypothetical protein